MTANIVDNVRNALSTYPVKAVCGWNDSTVALHWIKREVLTSSSLETDYAKEFIEWRHVDSNQSPADIGSRGCKVDQLLSVWLQGPRWLPNQRSGLER